MVYAKGLAAAPAATITIKNTNIGTVSWSNLKAATNGGGFYINHPSLSISMAVPLAVTTSQAVAGFGGFFYILQAATVNIAQATFKAISSAQSGSYLYSSATGITLTVSSTTIDCANFGTGAPWVDLSATLATPTNNVVGAFYITNAAVQTVVNSMTLRNCYTGDTGGAFSMVNADLSDISSAY